MLVPNQQVFCDLWVNLLDFKQHSSNDKGCYHSTVEAARDQTNGNFEYFSSEYSYTLNIIFDKTKL